jgi:hypothetical protein
LHTRDLFSGSTTGEARGNDAGEPSLAVFGFQWNLNRHAGSLCCLKIRSPPYRPYLTFSPSAFVFPLKFTGGGYSGGGKLMIDSQGNAWVADNFLPGSQNQDASWTGTLSKFAPNGKALSPSPFGFTGGGLGGPGFGLTLDAQENVWVNSFTGENITKFDKAGKPLSPPTGWNFNAQISQM